MEKNLLTEYEINQEIITPEDDAHYFFGYYDMRATDQKGRHLCHRVPFMDRFPTAEDVAEVGYLENRVFTPIGTTTAWNFQQGAMLQYHPTEADTVYYNVFEDGAFRTVTHNFATGEKRYTDRATGCISPDGRWGLAINFGRIFAFRPGYGYAGYVDDYADVNAPLEDGVFLVDMQTGISRQIIDYVSLAAVAGFSPEQKVLVNHITFNKTSDRFVMLVRNFRQEGSSWSTSLVLGDLDGSIKTVLPNTYVSHYDWKNDHQLLAHCTVRDEIKGMYLVDVDTCGWVEYDMPYFHEQGNPDIHCNYSPDQKYIIGDGYPKDGYRHLLAYRVDTGESRCLLQARTNKIDTDLRCDLHARFIWGGKAISYDTTQNGKREIAVFSTDVLNF